MLTTPGIRYVLYIGTTPDRVWNSLTRNKDLKIYWGDIRSTWVPQTEVVEVDVNGKPLWRGEVLRCDASALLSFTFEPGGGEPPTEVNFTLESPETPIAPGSAVTKLIFRQSGFAADSKSFPAFADAWPEILSSLKTFLETGSPLAFAWKK